MVEVDDSIMLIQLLKIEEYILKCKQEEAICEDCRTLLKPWPQKDKPLLKEIETSPSNEIKLTNQAGSQKCQEIDDNELKKVEDILLKAQKMREIQSEGEKSHERRELQKISQQKATKPEKPKNETVKEQKENITKNNVKKTKTSGYKAVYETAPYKTQSVPNNKRKNSAKTRAQKPVSSNVKSVEKSDDKPSESYNSSVSQSLVDSVSTRLKINTDDKQTVNSKISETVAGPLIKTTNCDTSVDTAGNRNSTDLPFSLLEDGKNLKVPGKLKNLMMRNFKLKQEILKSAASSKSSNPFFAAMDNYLNQANPASLHRRIHHLTSSYETRTELLRKLCPRNITGSSDIGNLLMSKLVLEKTLIFLAETEQEYRTVKKAATKVKIDEQRSCPIEKYIKQSHTIHQTDSSASEIMSYSKLSILQRHSQLNFQRLVLEDEIELVEKSAQLLNGFKTLDIGNHETVDVAHLYRGAYALLCSNGRQFPAVLTDYGADIDDSCIDDT